ncbi:MAG: tandem-95 repeat protein [Deltaproteobacteria bacterium]|jgi:hypothetical protein
MRARIWLPLLVAIVAPRPAEAVDIIVNGSASTFVIHFNGGYTQERADAVAAGAQFWADRLGSSVDIEVDMAFAPLSCSPSSGVLGSAGATTVVRDFAGAPQANTWYPPALANSLAGSDLDSGRSDISATFNSSIDDPAQESSCLTGLDWYYGQGSAPSGTIGFYGVVLHELAHGLGFQTFADLGGSGALFYGRDDHFIRHLEDNSSGRSLASGSMNDSERYAAARDDGDLIWSGPMVTAAATYLTAGRSGSEVQMYAPSSYRGGSSISHFDTRVSPNAVMEPFETGSTNTTLSEALFYEVGWGAPAGIEITAQQPLSVAEDNTITLAVSDFTVNDPSGSPPGQRTLLVAGGSSYTVNGTTITPAVNYSGPLSVGVTVSNGTDTSPTFVATVDVTPVNDAPQIVGQAPVVMNEDASRTIVVADLSINDPDDTTFTLAVQPGANYTRTGATITPDANFAGVLSVPVSVSDGEASSPVFDLVVEVRPANDPPVVTAHAAQSIPEDTTLRLSLSDFTFSDADDPPVGAFSLRIAPSVSYTVDDGEVVRPDADFFGTLSVTIAISDGTDESAPYTFPVEVTPVNDQPRIIGQTGLAVPEDGSIVLEVADVEIFDPDGDGGSFSLSVAPGVHYAVNGRVVTPDEDFDGTLSVPVTVTDGIETSPAYALSINVSAEPDAPEIVGQRAITMQSNATYRLGTTDLTIEDVDSSNPPYGVEIDAGADYNVSGADVTPAPNFVGDLDVPVRLTDTGLTSNTFVVRIAVVARPLDALTMNAAGLLTAADAIAVPSQLGALTGTVTVTLHDAPAFFRPGRHDLTWRGENEDGEEVFVAQRLDLMPVVSLSMSQVVAEGDRTSFSILLNGPSPVDELTIPYVVGGDADGADHDLASGSVVFGPGEVEKVVPFQVYEDTIDEGTETVVVTIEGARHEARIVEANLAPRVDIETLQAGLRTRIFHRTSGAVALASSVDDSNPKDRTTVSYTYPSGDRIDPATMLPGVYGLGVTVLDNGTPAKSTQIDWWFRIIDALPVLSPNEDSDGDGIDDATEGFEDVDLDGVPAYLDAWSLGHALAIGPEPHHVVDASPGTHLSLGKAALDRGRGRLTARELPADDAAIADASYVDVIAELNNAGQSVRLVVPLVAPLAAEQVVRVLGANNHWTTLPMLALTSAPLVNGACPEWSNTAYRAGLNPGDHCVCVAVRDGAQGDRDGRSNQRIELIAGLGRASVAAPAEGGETVVGDNDPEASPDDEPEGPIAGLLPGAEGDDGDTVGGGAGCVCVRSEMPNVWWLQILFGLLLLMRWAVRRQLALQRARGCK